MVLACAGYRVGGSGHHMTTFQGIRLAIGAKVEPLATYFDSCRRKRNTVDYERAGIVSNTEAHAYRALAEEWIFQNHARYAQENP